MVRPCRHSPRADLLPQRCCWAQPAASAAIGVPSPPERLLRPRVLGVHRPVQCLRQWRLPLRGRHVHLRGEGRPRLHCVAHHAQRSLWAQQQSLIGTCMPCRHAQLCRALPSPGPGQAVRPAALGAAAGICTLWCRTCNHVCAPPRPPVSGRHRAPHRAGWARCSAASAASASPAAATSRALRGWAATRIACATSSRPWVGARPLARPPARPPDRILGTMRLAGPAAAAC